MHYLSQSILAQSMQLINFNKLEAKQIIKDKIIKVYIFEQLLSFYLNKIT